MEAFEKILKCERLMVDGRLVNCNIAFKENKQKKDNSTENCKVFIGGLHNDVNNEELTEYFNKVSGGKVENAYVVKNEI